MFFYLPDNPSEGVAKPATAQALYCIGAAPATRAPPKETENPVDAPALPPVRYRVFLRFATGLGETGQSPRLSSAARPSAVSAMLPNSSDGSPEAF